MKMTTLPAKMAVLAVILGFAGPFGTAQAQIIVSGNLIANLQNGDLTASTNVWVNQATGTDSVGNFSTVGAADANVVSIGGFNGLNINTTASNAMQSALSVPASITGNGSMTVEEWVYTTNLYSGFDAHNNIASYGDTSGSHTSRSFSYSATGNGSDAFGTDNFNDLGYQTNPPTGAWTLVDFTYDSTTNLASVYVNGTLNVSGNLSTLGTDASVFTIGAGVGGSDPFAGSIGALRVEDGVLTQSQIASNYSQGVGGEIAVAPEPSTYALISAGLGGILLMRRFRRVSV